MSQKNHQSEKKNILRWEVKHLNHSTCLSSRDKVLPEGQKNPGGKRQHLRGQKLQYKDHVIIPVHSQGWIYTRGSEADCTRAVSLNRKSLAISRPWRTFRSAASLQHMTICFPCWNTRPEGLPLTSGLIRDGEKHLARGEVEAASAILEMGDGWWLWFFRF